MFDYLPGSAWADGKLAELAEQQGKMGEHPESKSTQPVLQEMCHPVLDIASPKTVFFTG